MGTCTSRPLGKANPFTCSDVLRALTQGPADMDAFMHYSKGHAVEICTCTDTHHGAGGYILSDSFKTMSRYSMS